MWMLSKTVDHSIHGLFEDCFRSVVSHVLSRRGHSRGRSSHHLGRHRSVHHHGISCSRHWRSWPPRGWHWLLGESTLIVIVGHLMLTLTRLHLELFIIDTSGLFSQGTGHSCSGDLTVIPLWLTSLFYNMRSYHRPLDSELSSLRRNYGLITDSVSTNLSSVQMFGSVYLRSYSYSRLKSLISEHIR